MPAYGAVEGTLIAPEPGPAILPVGRLWCWGIHGPGDQHLLKATGCPGRLPKSCSVSLPSTRGATDIREEALLQVAQQHSGYSFTGGPSPRAASGSLGAGRVETYDQRRSFTENASYLKTHFAW